MSTFHHRYFIGSEEYLNRLLMNLAGNAVKYNRRGGKVILYFNEISSDDKTQFLNLYVPIRDLV